MSRKGSGISERTVERGLVGACKAEGWECLKIEGAMGWPDRLVVANGSLAFVELKRPVGGRLSPMQRHVFAKLAALGHEVRIAKSREDVEKLIKELRK